MSSAADALRAQAALAASKPSTKAVEMRTTSADVGAGRNALQTAKLTVRLPRNINQSLRQMLLDEADDHGVSRISLQQITEELYVELLRNRSLRDRVIERAVANN